jgi:prepilin-type N-terminal cleavage/methylation domain-containing protein
MNLNQKRTVRRAFTLIEVMVALALLGMVVVAIYSSWTAILKGSKVALTSAASAQRARITERTLHDSLLCTCVFNENIRYYSFLADTEGKFSSLSFVARLPRSFPRSGKFGDLSVRRLTFNVESGADSKSALVLRQNPLLTEMDKDEEENPLVLAKNVTEFDLEFWDLQKGDWVTEWANTNQLPRMVRITLKMGNGDQYAPQAQDVMVSTVALPAQPVRVEWQMPMLPGQNQNLQGSTNGLGSKFKPN